MPLFSFGENEGQTTPSAMYADSEARLSSQFALRSSGGEETVRLTCLSPDGTFFHCLGSGDQYIEVQKLPLKQVQGDRSDIEEPPCRIRTTLPDWVQAALRIDPPLELLCVEGEGLPRRSEGDPRQRLPRLCVYTKKNAYLLELSYEVPQQGYSGDTVRGSVVSVTQPFEMFLDSSSSNEILRIRPAPQRHAGFATMCPGASMAALVFNTEFEEYTLFLHHSNGKVVRPLVFGMEVMVDRSRERIVDFCFVRSNELSIFSSLSVIMVKGSGDMFSASPIVFDGTVVSSSSLRDGLDYLDAILESTDRATAKWRQCRAAQQYLLDVFNPLSSRRERFSTARIVSLAHVKAFAASWPVKLQGPILFCSAADPGPPARAVENFGDHANLVGIAVGKSGYAVDFAVVSPTCLLPRFSFESDSDARDVDDSVFQLSAWVERLQVKQQDHSVLENSIALLPDPLVDTLIHYATSRSVVTVSSNIMRLVGQRQDPASLARTTAWSCLQTSSGGSPLQGILVHRDEDNNVHELVACQADGSTINANLTEQQFIHEVDALFKGSAQSVQALQLTDGASDDVLTSLESTTPLYESVHDLVEKIKSGMAGMGKIVGSTTNYKDITPDTLAVAVHIKERCDNELVLPLLELKKVVEARREKLLSVLKNQRKQLEALAETEARQKGRMQELVSKIENYESNAATLIERVINVHESCKGLIPKVTEAESEFFKDVERLKERCSYLEAEMHRAKERISSQCASLSESTPSDSIKSIDPEIVRKANAMLNDQSNTIRQIRERLKNVEASTERLVS